MEKTCPGWKDHPPTRTVFTRNKTLPRLESVTHLARSPFSGSVTLLAGLAFLHINTLARPAGSIRSRQENQSMSERCYQLLAQVKGSTLVKVDPTGRVTLFRGTTFLHINRVSVRFLQRVTVLSNLLEQGGNELE